MQPMLFSPYWQQRPLTLAEKAAKRKIGTNNNIKKWANCVDMKAFKKKVKQMSSFSKEDPKGMADFIVKNSKHKKVGRCEVRNYLDFLRDIYLGKIKTDDTLKGSLVSTKANLKRMIADIEKDEIQFLNDFKPGGPLSTRNKWCLI